ncbi:MAG: efflux RND transporter periplasmic adaptor subunit [Rhodospirillales bacterium]
MMIPVLRRTLPTVCVVLALMANSPAAGQQVALVGVDPVRVAPMTQTVPVLGRLVARQAGVVAARVQGPVDEIQVEVGDRIDRDAVIAVLDRDRVSSQYDLRVARVAEAEAALSAARAELNLKRQELARIEGLRASPAFSKGVYEDKQQELVVQESQLTRAAADLASARAELRLAEIAVRDAEIRAPYAGVVTRRHTEVGAHVDVGDPVVSLVDDRSLEIEADVPAQRIGGLTPGTGVAVALGGRTLFATVRATIPEENPLTRTRTVRLVPELEDLTDLASNQSVTVHVPADTQRQVLTVHKDGVLTRRGQHQVVVVVDGAAEVRPVRLGEAVGDRFEVLDGLADGEPVVVRGNERLRPGQKVRYAGGAQG